MNFSMVNPRLIDFEEERLKCKQCSYFSNFSGGCTFVRLNMLQYVQSVKWKTTSFVWFYPVSFNDVSICRNYQYGTNRFYHIFLSDVQVLVKMFN